MQAATPAPPSTGLARTPTMEAVDLIYCRVPWLEGNHLTTKPKLAPTSCELGLGVANSASKAQLALQRGICPLLR